MRICPFKTLTGLLENRTFTDRRKYSLHSLCGGTFPPLLGNVPWLELPEFAVTQSYLELPEFPMTQSDTTLYFASFPSTAHGPKLISLIRFLMNTPKPPVVSFGNFISFFFSDYKFPNFYVTSCQLKV